MLSGDSGVSDLMPDHQKLVLVLLAGVVLLALVWVYRKWEQTKNYWSARNVPSSPPHPLLGSLAFLLKQNPAIWMRDNYDRNQPYFGVWWFWRPALVINSPEIARMVLVKDAAIFRNRFLSSGKNDPIGSLNLFLGNDPLWSLMRRRLSPVFTASKLRHFQAQFITKSKELVQRIKTEMASNKRVNLRYMFTDYTTDVIGITALGVSSDATLTGTGPLRTITKDFMMFNYARALEWVCIFFFPELAEVFRFTFFPKSATKYFRKVFRSVVDQRGGYDAEITESRDFVDTLRKIKQQCDRNNEEMSEDVLIAQAAAFLQAGFDTTGTTLSFCVYELAFHPTAQDNIYKELLPVKDNILNNDIDADVLSEMKYLSCVLKETMRKYPPMGWLDRLASADYKIDDKLTITAGTPVYVNSIGMHYDPEHFTEPYKFLPERFLPENEKKIKPYSFIPFGDGPRFCIGSRFALQNMNCVLANIVLNYRLVPAPGAPLPVDVKVENRGLFYVPGETLYVQFIPRVT